MISIFSRPVSDNRASLLRSSAPPRKPASERETHLVIWRNYATLSMRVVPPAPSPVIRCASPDLSLRYQLNLFRQPVSTQSLIKYIHET